MEHIIHGYQPEALFRYFEELSAIPRGSGNEAAVADYLVAFAQEHALTCHRDQLHNVVIKKSGSDGCGSLPAIMIQGHTDMVCEKNADVDHDFEKDGLDLYVEDGMLRARGTTLGADDGVAVATMMALLADDSLRHPPLECVFTVQEETGLFGAVALDPAPLTARTLINLDSEEEGIATVSCAGGVRVRLSRKSEWIDCPGYYGLQVSVRGLPGGHSGMDIDKQRGNSIKLMGRILNHLRQVSAFGLADLSGGSKDNAIPRESDCLLVFQSSAQRDNAATALTKLADDLADEYRPTCPGFSVTLCPVQAPSRYLRAEDANALIDLICLGPDGVRRRDMTAGGFVVASVNMGVVIVTDAEAAVLFTPRSSVASLQEATKEELARFAELLGFAAQFDSEYPGWAYAPESRIRDTFCKVYRELFGAEMKVEAIHAGLECGIFQSKLPGLDAIALGPNVHGCHTPDEHLDLASCERMWRLVTGVLEAYTH